MNRLTRTTCVEPSCDREREVDGQRCVLHTARLGALPELWAPEPVEAQGPAAVPVPEVVSENRPVKTRAESRTEKRRSALAWTVTLALSVSLLVSVVWPESGAGAYRLELLVIAGYLIVFWFTEWTGKWWDAS